MLGSGTSSWVLDYNTLIFIYICTILHCSLNYFLFLLLLLLNELDLWWYACQCYTVLLQLRICRLQFITKSGLPVLRQSPRITPKSFFLQMILFFKLCLSILPICSVIYLAMFVVQYWELKLWIWLNGCQCIGWRTPGTGYPQPKTGFRFLSTWLWL